MTFGDPVFGEPLAVAFDNSVEDNDSLVAAVDEIVGQLRDEGVLYALGGIAGGSPPTSTAAICEPSTTCSASNGTRRSPPSR